MGAARCNLPLRLLRKAYETGGLPENGVPKLQGRDASERFFQVYVRHLILQLCELWSLFGFGECNYVFWGSGMTSYMMVARKYTLAHMGIVGSSMMQEPD